MTKWIKKFCSTKGLSHLFNALMNLPIATLNNPLSRRCFSLLIKIVNMIQKEGFKLVDYVEDYPSKRKNMVERILIILNAFCKYSIPKSKERNVSESPSKKAKVNEEVQLRTKKGLEMESIGLCSGFSLIKSEEQNYFEYATKFFDFKEFILNGLVLTGNSFIKNCFKDEILWMLSLCKKEESDKSFVQMLIPYLLKDMITETIIRDIDSACLFTTLCSIIRDYSRAELEKLPINFPEEMKSICNHIKERKVKENKPTDADHLLVGLLKLLYELVSKFPKERNIVAVNYEMLDEVIHKCLFDFPAFQSRSKLLIPPKCKSLISRKAALELITMMCLDSPTVVSKVLDFLMPIHTNAPWRTNSISDWQITSKSEEKSITGYVGLKNLGAICYMNSLLQQLYMIPSFRNEILAVEDSEISTKPEENLLFQTQSLFSALNMSVKQYYNPKPFCHALKDWENKSIDVVEQMDVDEFFNLFLDRLETALKKTPQKNVIKEHFGGMTADQIIGKDCPHTSTRTEPFLAINLQVKGKRNLQQCLESYVEGEMLQGSNAYFCDKCDKKVSALKRTCIKRLPRYFICVLKRFDLDYDTMQKFKVNDYCEFPMKLNMENYTQEGLTKQDLEKEREKARNEGRDFDESSIKKLKTYPPEYYEYKLMGVVIHIGTSDAGHYCSIILDREHEEIPEEERWYEFNDTQVNRYYIEDLKEDAFGNEGKFNNNRYFIKAKNAYMLFYERASSYEPPEEDEDETTEASITTKSPTSKANIPKNIYKEIQENNSKYWHNKYIFQKDYFDFVYKMGIICCLKGETLDKYEHLAYNLDHHLLNLELPDTKSEKISESEEATSSEEQKQACIRIAKYILTVFLTTVIRSKEERNAKNMVDFMKLCKVLLNKYQELSQWLILQFTNENIIKELIIESADKIIQKFIVGLLYCAMLNVYKVEKASILECDPSKSILLNFANGWFHCLLETSNPLTDAEQFFQIFSRLTFLGPEIRFALLKQNFLRYLLVFLYSSDGTGKYNSKLRCENISKLKWNRNENVELGLPLAINDKLGIKSTVNQYRMKSYNLGPSYNFLIEIISLLMRSTTSKGKASKSPFALESCQVDMELADDIKDCLSNPKGICGLIIYCESHLAITALIKALSHVSWEDLKMKTALAMEITSNLSQLDLDKLDKCFCFIKTLLEANDSIQPTIVNMVLNDVVKVIRQASANYRMSCFLKLILGLIQTLPVVETWFKNNVQTWDWLINWLKENLEKKSSKSGRDYIITINKMNEDMQSLQESKIKQYLQFLESLKKGEQLPKMRCIKDIEPMYYSKFSIGQMLEHVSRRMQAWELCTVKEVLDEILIVKPERLSEDNIELVEVESDTIAKIGTHIEVKGDIKEASSGEKDFKINLPEI